MRVFIRRDQNGDFPNINFAIAYDGFKQMGWEIINYHDEQQLSTITKEDLFVGFVHESKQVMEHLNIDIPSISCYPEALNSYYGRKIWRNTLHNFLKENQFNIFIKPAESNKLFTGKLIRSFRDLISIGHQPNDINIWCAEPVKIGLECRCFVRYGEILDIRNYKGNWRLQPDIKRIENIINNFDTTLNAYALDFGVTPKGETIVIELNDAYALGNYGLFSIDYCKLLNARWTQIMGTKDILSL